MAQIDEPVTAGEHADDRPVKAAGRATDGTAQHSRFDCTDNLEAGAVALVAAVQSHESVVVGIQGRLIAAVDDGR